MVIVYKCSEPKTKEVGKNKTKVMYRTLSYYTLAGKDRQNIDRRFRIRDPDTPMSKSMERHIAWAFDKEDAKKRLSEYRSKHRKSANPKKRNRKNAAPAPEPEPAPAPAPAHRPGRHRRRHRKEN